MSRAVSRRLWRRSTSQLVQLRFERQRSTEAVLGVHQGGCPFHQTGGTNVHKPVTATARMVKDSGISIRPFEAIPNPKGLPLLGTSIDIAACGGASKMHEYCHKKHMELGPIFRDKLGTSPAVVISDKDLIQSVYYYEGRYPVHLVPLSWTLFNELNGIKRGLFFMDGELWELRRKCLNKVLMNPTAVSTHAPDFNEVTTDLLKRWDDLVKTNDSILPQLENELYNWSIESLGTMLFGRRLGCVKQINDVEGPLNHDFVQCVQQIFAESAKLTIIPPTIARFLRLPVWKRFSSAATNALSIARKYVEERMAEINEMHDAGNETSGVLSQLMADGNICKDEIVSIVADLVLAAADTTSHATQWALHSLAVNPQCQEKLLTEIKNACPQGETLNETHIRSIPYSLLIVKETLRKFPIASFLTRVLPEDIVLAGYNVPAGTLIVMSQYTLGKDPNYFDDPEAFKPERWKKENREVIGSQGCIPFGVGLRSCIGRRVAELQMRLVLSKAVQKFHFESANAKDEVEPAMRMIMTTNVPVKLRLTRR